MGASWCIHCYRADDMINMLQLADEVGFDIRSFHHATSAYKLRDILAEREVSVSTWADWWGLSSRLTMRSSRTPRSSTKQALGRSFTPIPQGTFNA